MTPVTLASPATPPTEPAPGRDAAVGRVHGSVRACLPWADMCAIPRHYEDFSAWHFRRLSPSAGTTWSEACPAYALAYLTHSAYRSPVSADEATELEAQWDELRGPSTLEWPQAFAIVQEAWRYLA